MFKCFLLFVIFFSFVKSLPFPQNANSGLKLLAGRETRYYQFPFFWFGRLVNGDDYDETVINNEPFVNLDRRSSTVSYINAGAGWGR